MPKTHAKPRKESPPATAEGALLVESFDIPAAGFEVDAEAGVVRGVMAIKPRSTKGREYSESYMRSNPALYNGLPVLSPHLSEQRKVKTGVGDVAGHTANARFDESRGGTVVDVEAAPNDLGKTFLWAAGKKWRRIGLSHEAQAGRVTGGGRLIESWNPVRLAIVFDPATTTGLDESQADKGDDMELSALTLEELKAARADLVKAVLAESDDARKRGEVEVKLKESEGRIAALEAEKGAAEMEKVAAKLLSESKLPDASKTEKLRAAVAGQKDEEAAKAYLGTLEESIAAARKPVSAERKATGGEGGEGGEVDARECVRRLTGRRG